MIYGNDLRNITLENLPIQRNTFRTNLFIMKHVYMSTMLGREKNI